MDAGLGRRQGLLAFALHAEGPRPFRALWNTRAMPEKFIFLTNEEFDELPTEEKISYLRRAVDAKKEIDRQLADHLERLLAEANAKKK
jgi:hypothetical protein